MKGMEGISALGMGRFASIAGKLSCGRSAGGVCTIRIKGPLISGRQRSLFRGGGVGARAMGSEAGWGTGILESAKNAAANTLLKTFMTGTGFDAQFEDIRVVRVGTGEVEVELEVTDKLLNPYKTLHGGATCTLVDIVGTLAIVTRDPTKAGASVELNVSFLSAAKKGETIIAVGKAVKVGRTLSFTEVTVTEKTSGKVIAMGRHTKAT